MEIIHSIELSLTSLMILFVIPFLFFGYHSKYWYHPRKLKSFDFLLQVIAILLALVVLFKLKGAFHQGRDAIQLALLHLGPLVLTLLIVSSFRKGGQARSGKASGNQKGDNKSEGFAPVPLTSKIEQLGWDDLIINEGLKDELKSVINLLQSPKHAQKYGISVPKGILLEGPPGTGKTTVAKVIANTAKLSFFVLKSDEVVSKWVGESEKNLTRLFNAALKHAPSVIFIDEVDSIGKQRSGKGQQWAENLLNHLLQLIDGIVKAEGLYVIAATNRADLVDSALKRAGRLNKIITIPLPDFESRMLIFKLYLSKLNLEANMDLELLAQLTEGNSGADIKEICNQAGLNAFKRESGEKRRNYLVSHQDLEVALAEFAKEHN